MRIADEHYILTVTALLGFLTELVLQPVNALVDAVYVAGCAEVDRVVEQPEGPIAQPVHADRGVGVDLVQALLEAEVRVPGLGAETVGVVVVVVGRLGRVA